MGDLDDLTRSVGSHDYHSTRLLSTQGYNLASFCWGSELDL